METDIGRMGDNPRFEPAPLDDYQEFQHQTPQYQQHQPPQYQQQYEYAPPPAQTKKVDFFADIDKKAWIFILVALIIGFFMGKTMQPIILKTS
jgi:hypothetical protein